MRLTVSKVCYKKFNIAQNLKKTAARFGACQIMVINY